MNKPRKLPEADLGDPSGGVKPAELPRGHANRNLNSVTKIPSKSTWAVVKDEPAEKWRKAG